MNDLFIQKAKKIKLLLTDVDGVMTDGTLSFFTGEDGKTREIKHFESLDGMGLLFLRYCGVQTGIISKGMSPTLEYWAKALGMNFLCYNMPVKHKALEYILDKTGIRAEETAFIGDDLIDLGVLTRAGLPLAVANSVEEVKAKAVYVSERRGGAGAVRDLAERILKARREWDRVVQDVQSGVFQNPQNPLEIITKL